jgi:hypothetical protein
LRGVCRDMLSCDSKLWHGTLSLLLSILHEPQLRDSVWSIPGHIANVLSLCDTDTSPQTPAREFVPFHKQLFLAKSYGVFGLLVKTTTTVLKDQHASLVLSPAQIRELVHFLGEWPLKEGLQGYSIDHAGELITSLCHQDVVASFTVITELLRLLRLGQKVFAIYSLGNLVTLEDDYQTSRWQWIYGGSTGLLTVRIVCMSCYDSSSLIMHAQPTDSSPFDGRVCHEPTEHGGYISCMPLDM